MRENNKCAQNFGRDTSSNVTIFCILFSCDVCSSCGLLVNNEFERIWKEADVDKFEVLSGRLSRGTEESHDKQ
jgi:hypothetical protein